MAKRTPAAKKAEAETGAGTEYVVLKQEKLDGMDASVWLPVKNVIASSKQNAIRAHTGEGADVVEGTWKAIPLSSWKGGETTKRVTAAARLPLLDG